MAERIGNVLYWLGCIVAAPVAGLGIFVYVAEGHGRSDGLIMLIIFLVLATVPMTNPFGLAETHSDDIFSAAVE
jgi:hypothetical protein